MTTTINGRTPEEIKRGLECCSTLEPINEPCSECSFAEINFGVCSNFVCADALALINQLQEDKKRLQERICNHRRQLRLLHAMYEWALSRLQKAKLNDRAHFQAWMRERGYDLKTMELPESKYQQLERERDAAVEDIFQTCSNCKHEKLGFGVGPCPPVEEYVKMIDCSNWQWRGVQEVE